MEIKGYLAKTELTEQFKGEVSDVVKKWPNILGAEHPFNFEDTEKVYKKVGIVSGIINKYADSIVGDFKIKVDNPNSQAILDRFLKDTNFQTVIRAWVREALLKGNGFIELDLKNSMIRVMNANNMYVKRDRFGKVLEYNQFTGDLNKFNRETRNDSKIFVNFFTNEIAHLTINKMPNDPYGIGIIWPNERVIENIVKDEQDKQKLTGRKAGAPIHVTIGQPGEATQKQVIDDFAASLQYMNNRTEWVTDANVKMEVLQFGEIGKNLTESLMYNYRMLLAGVEMPEVLMGSGQLNEGIAKVQLEGWNRNIKSKRLLVQSIIEEKIFKPLLNSNKLDESIEFIWDDVSNEETELRIANIQRILSTMGISENMKRGLEIELARLMDMEDLIEVLPEPEQGLENSIDPRNPKVNNPEFTQIGSPQPENKERKKEENIPQPEVPGAKPKAKAEQESILIESQEILEDDLSIQEFVNFNEIQEAQGNINYSDLVIETIKILKGYGFNDLAASTEKDLEMGLLDEKDIEKLRLILKNGFKKNQSIRDIEKELKQNIKFQDRINPEGTLMIAAESRPNMIARTETVRLANEGLKQIYKDNGIKKIRFLAAVSDRTCDICMGLNGNVYEMNELNVGTNQPPIHPNCRCSILSVLE